MTGIATQGPEAPKPFRYDYEIDREGDSPQMRVVRFVGSHKRVLELGCGSGTMSRVLREQGCSVVGVELDPDAAARAQEHCDRVIVGDLDQLDLLKELTGDTFDVVVAADVLEHLKEPATVLGSVRTLLRAHGRVVALVPNVAHASVRLALLTGQFPYSDLGLLDRTHLHFYTRETLESLFEQNGYVIEALGRNVVSLEHAEVPFDRARVPAAVLSKVADEPEALTYQFIVIASPAESIDNHVVSFQLDELSRRLEASAALVDELRTAKDAIELEAAGLRESLDLATAKSELATEEVAKLRQALLERTSEELAAGPQEVRVSVAETTVGPEALADLRAELTALNEELALSIQQVQLSGKTEERLATLRGELEAARADVADACRQRDAMRIALRRVARAPASRDELEARHAQLAAGRDELEATHAKLAASRDELEAMHAKFAASRDELEAKRAQLANEMALTQYWHDRYDGLRSRLETMLRRFGIALALRVVPTRVRRFASSRLLGPPRS